MGSQSLTNLKPLVDNYGRVHDYLRISLTDRCNFRCLYCMPEEGIEWQERSQILTLEEIEQLVQIFAKLGINKVRLTGGEPSVRKGYLNLISSISKTPGINKVLLTTNGTSLSKHAQQLKDSGLTGINISLDSLCPDRFYEITRRDDFDKVMDGISAAIQVGFDSVKINVVVMSDLNEDEILDFVNFADQNSVQVRFIEFMPFLGNQWKASRVIRYKEILETIESKYALEAIPGHRSDVAKEFALRGSKGTIGFVTSVSDSFCGGCNRLRLTSDGKFKTCLFLPAKSSLRDMLRQGKPEEEIVNTIREDLLTKWAAHPPMESWRQLDSLAMVEIGG